MDRAVFCAMARKFLLFSTVCSLVLAMGLGSYLNRLPPALPESLISFATVINERGEVVLWQLGPGNVRFLQEQVQSEFIEVERFLRSIQAIRPAPVRLRFQLNLREPLKYAVHRDRIELGRDLAAAKGQVRHALLKAWLMENADSRITLRTHRLDVIADVWAAIMSGSFALQVPGFNEHLRYDENMQTRFLEHAASLGHLCRSPWRSNALLSLCMAMFVTEERRDGNITPFAFRKLLGEQLWRAYASIGVFRRPEFLLSWIRSLTSRVQVDENEEVSGDPENASLRGWHIWAQREIDEILPTELCRVGNSSLALEGFSVDIAAEFATRAAAENFTRTVLSPDGVIQLPAARTAVLSHEESFILLPGEVRLSGEDLTQIQSHSLIWDGCVAPSSSQLLAYPLRLERALIVQNCNGNGDRARYRSFVRDGNRRGVESFALDNPELRFVHVHLPSLQYAVAHGLVSPQSPFFSMLKEHGMHIDRKLGLSHANWNPALKAFHVNGAVEAINWFRPE